MTMGVTLLVVGLAVLVATTLAGAGVFQLSLAAMQSNQTSARQAAESAAAAALSTVLADSAMKWGRPGTGDSITCQFGTASASLTFDATVATHNGIPQSVNNFQQPSLQAPDVPSETIPANNVWVAGVGTSDNCRTVVINVLTFPQFPYPIAANSAIDSAGGLLVGCAPSGMTAAQLAIDPSKLLAATVDSNQTSATAISLGSGSYVAGDVRASGGIQLGPNSHVGGSLLQNASAVALPTIDITQLDPALTQLNVPAPAGNPLSGFNRTAGDYNVSGPLTLNNGVLYVEGNLTVSGGIQGTGAVFVTGTTTINGPTQIATTAQMALVSRGDITLNATAGQSAYFRGLVYTEGTLHASQIVLDGTFVANNASTAQVQMNDTTVLYEPQMSTQSFSVYSNGTSGAGGGIFYNSAGQALSWQLPYEFNFDLMFAGNNDPSNLIHNGQVIPDSQLQQLMASSEELYMVSPTYAASIGAQPPQLWNAMASQLASLSVYGYGSSGSMHITSPSQLSTPGLQNACIHFSSEAAMERWVLTNYPNPPGETAAHFEQMWNQAMQDAVAQARQKLQAFINNPALLQPQPAGNQTFTFDLNQFIKPADRARLALWKQL
jgi:hypothetical protein